MISLCLLFFESPYKCSLAPPAKSTVGPFLESPLSYGTREVVCLFVFRVHVQDQGVTSF